MKNAIVIGGSSGLGLAISIELLNRFDKVYIFDIKSINSSDVPASISKEFFKRVEYLCFDITSKDRAALNEKIKQSSALFITAGVGRLSLLEDLDNNEINKLFAINALGPIQIIKDNYDLIKSKKDLYCSIIGSIAGHISSPFLSAYGASKSALCSFIQSVNSELAGGGYQNRILEVSPGYLKETAFYGGPNNVEQLLDLADLIIEKALARETLFIPQYDEIYKTILEKNFANPLQFGVESYKYKMKQNRPNVKKQCVVGYLSGTFDLFHIGHLNLIKRAKEKCDYLIVGVHDSGSWKGKETFIPFKERLEIVDSLEYVDEAVEAMVEDSDAWSKYRFDKLFVGSDYKNTERFKRYEQFFKDKSVEIVYFPYTKSTSSTQIRSLIEKQLQKK